MASSSYSAKNGVCAQSGFRPCRNRSTSIFWPPIVATPETCTLPGVADMLGPLTVLASPLTDEYALLNISYALTSGTPK